MKRDYNYEIMPEIKARYATRAFSKKPVAREQLMAVFEAARYAPSCFNEQPWRFVVGNADDNWNKLAETLAEGNSWAKAAPVLILVCATPNFKLNNKPNAYSRFDAGQATAFLQLEAVRRGLAVHCMAGFSAKRAAELFALGELDAIAMIALGYPGDVESLPAELREEEEPGTRNPLDGLFI